MSLYFKAKRVPPANAQVALSPVVRLQLLNHAVDRDGDLTIGADVATSREVEELVNRLIEELNEFKAAAQKMLPF